MMGHKINFLKVWFTNQLVNEFKNSIVLVVILVIFFRSIEEKLIFFESRGWNSVPCFYLQKGNKALLSFKYCVLLISKPYLWWKPGVSILWVFPETNMSPKSNWMDLNTLVQLNPTQTYPKDFFFFSLKNSL